MNGCKANVGRNLTKRFDHKNEELRIYKKWEDSGSFEPRGEETFFIPMPPPNITGILHMGHALFATLQDISTRYHRMNGKAALWLPGTDHAGLATQNKLNQMMIDQGLDPDGPQFDDFAHTYKNNLKSSISDQLRRCGASCDWSRETFTLDDAYAEAVVEALSHAHDSGLLYERDNQWYLFMEDLAEELLDRMDDGEIEIIPSGQYGTLKNFLDNIEPWCISRQIRWGHRLPIWKYVGEIYAGQRCGDIKISAACPGDPSDWKQEEGCLDTWFSSALWPFATLGWPKDTEDMRRFYPASVIETADDILFFWCARMMMMGLLLTDQLPFSKIFLHGIIRDENGEKMSKSLGNGIDPLAIIDEYGCDAMRFALAETATPGQDMRIWDEKFLSAKSLTTKIWNASKFTLGHINRIGEPAERSDHPDDLSLISRTDIAHSDISRELERLRYHEAAKRLREFIYDDFCSYGIEALKDRLYGGDREALYAIQYSWETLLKLSHPFMPFMTERIYEALDKGMLITEKW